MSDLRVCLNDLQNLVWLQGRYSLYTASSYAVLVTCVEWCCNLWKIHCKIEFRMATCEKSVINNTLTITRLVPIKTVKRLAVMSRLLMSRHQLSQSFDNTKCNSI